MSSKGQRVIPKGLRLSAKLQLGDQLAVNDVQGEIRLRPLPAPATSLLDAVAGCLAKPGQQRLSDAQTQTAIKARLKARHAA
ncbi:MAG: AbrB/MazE/SpoVT family DNA-binding domain-containing protein [Betaproteobacteria bacterium]